MAISPIPFLPPLPVFLIKALCQADCSSDSNDTTESCAGGVWSWDDKEEDEEKLKLPFFCMLLAVAVGVRGNNMSSHLHIFRPDRVCISNCFWLLILQGDFSRFFGLWAALGRHFSSQAPRKTGWLQSSLLGFLRTHRHLGFTPESVLEIGFVCMEEFCPGKGLHSFLILEMVCCHDMMICSDQYMPCVFLQRC